MGEMDEGHSSMTAAGNRKECSLHFTLGAFLTGSSQEVRGGSLELQICEELKRVGSSASWKDSHRFPSGFSQKEGREELGSHEKEP